MKNWKVNILTVKLFSVAAKDLVFSGAQEGNGQRFGRLPLDGSVSHCNALSTKLNQKRTKNE